MGGQDGGPAETPEDERNVAAAPLDPYTYGGDGGGWMRVRNQSPRSMGIFLVKRGGTSNDGQDVHFDSLVRVVKPKKSFVVKGNYGDEYVLRTDDFRFRTKVNLNENMEDDAP